MKLASVQFDSGLSPTIAIVNLATVDLGVDLSALIAAMQLGIDKHFAPAWGCSATLMRAQKPAAKAWNMLFLDDADAPGALAYHDLTKDGFPVLKVFVKTTLADKALVSVSASHELWEALVDPACQDWSQNLSTGELWAKETADAVEETDFAVNGIPLSNFVLPSFFESFHKAGSRKFDHLGLLKKPFSLLKGGYTITMAEGKVGQKFGSQAKQQRFAREDRRQHRSEYRRAA